MRLLWIGAHPDDELFVAPWLGAMIETENAVCCFLVATRGESGACLLPQGCGPDLRKIREQEMYDAAEIFGGRVWFADCRDGSAPEPADVLRIWASEAGGSGRLESRFLSVIEEFRPDRIVTFDRSHGCSWHADHRAVGILVQSLALPIPITLAESRTTFTSPLNISGIPEAVVFDARSTWSYLLRDLACHPSQFSAETLELFS